MIRTRRETLIATALLAAIGGATLAQVLDQPSSPGPAPAVQVVPIPATPSGTPPSAPRPPKLAP